MPKTIDILGIQQIVRTTCTYLRHKTQPVHIRPNLK